MGDSSGQFAWIRKTIASMGFAVLYFLLLLPAMGLLEVVYRPWRLHTDVYLPFLARHVGEHMAVLITHVPLLFLILAVWIGTVKLVERLFRFRFP